MSSSLGSTELSVAPPTTTTTTTTTITDEQVEVKTETENVKQANTNAKSNTNSKTKTKANNQKVNAKLSFEAANEIVEMMNHDPELKQLIEQHHIRVCARTGRHKDSRIHVWFTTEVKQSDGTIERYTRYRADELFKPFSTFFRSALQQKQLNDVNPRSHISIGMRTPKRPE